MSIADSRTSALLGVVAAFASIALAIGLSALVPCAYATEGDLEAGQLEEPPLVQAEEGSGFSILIDYVPIVAGDVATFTAISQNDPKDKKQVELEKIYFEWQMSNDGGCTWIGKGDEDWPDALKKQSGVGCSTLRIPTKKAEESKSTSEDDAEDSESASDGDAVYPVLIRVVAYYDEMKTTSVPVQLVVIVDAYPEPEPSPEPVPPKPSSTYWNRLFGNNALDTMQSIVSNGFSNAGGTVVVATLDGYWDALAAAGLAGFSDAPVLMTEGSQLSKQTRAELERLVPSRVFVCGGPMAVSDDVCSQIESICGVRPHRIYGCNAVATAASINLQAPAKTGGAWSNEAFLCTSAGYWDALAVAPLAYALHMPIFLTEADGSLSASTLEAVRECGITKVHIAGGTAAVSASVDVMLGALLGERFAGADAVETSELIANFGLQRGMSANQLGVATTNGYWDALAGAALCGKRNSVLVLVDNACSSSIDGFVAANAESEDIAFVFGGPAAVSDGVLDRLKSATLLL